MAEERRVEMVRLVSEERYYDRESLLGRDAASVFPTLARQQEEEAGAAGLSVEAIKEALGARKFISETELESLRATRGATADDGAVAVDKPLAEILRERKAAKDAEHEEKWKQMKIGKNRPLDADELHFLDSVAAAEAEREKAWNDMERAELEAFKAAVRERSADPETNPGAEGGAEGSQRVKGPGAVAGLKVDPRIPSVASTAAPSLLPKPVIKALVKVKPKAPSGGEAVPAGSGTASAKDAPPSVPSTAVAAGGQGAAAAAEPPSKRAKTTVGTEQAAETAAAGANAGTGAGAIRGTGTEGEGVGGAGLAGLIGDYGSDSDGGGD